MNATDGLTSTLLPYGVRSAASSAEAAVDTFAFFSIDEIKEKKNLSQLIEHLLDIQNHLNSMREDEKEKLPALLDALKSRITDLFRIQGAEIATITFVFRTFQHLFAALKKQEAVTDFVVNIRDKDTLKESKIKVPVEVIEFYKGVFKSTSTIGWKETTNKEIALTVSPQIIPFIVDYFNEGSFQQLEESLLLEIVEFVDAYGWELEALLDYCIMIYSKYLDGLELRRVGPFKYEMHIHSFNQSINSNLVRLAHRCNLDFIKVYFQKIVLSAELFNEENMSSFLESFSSNIPIEVHCKEDLLFKRMAAGNLIPQNISLKVEELHLHVLISDWHYREQSKKDDDLGQLFKCMPNLKRVFFHLPFNADSKVIMPLIKNYPNLCLSISIKIPLPTMQPLMQPFSFANASESVAIDSLTLKDHSSVQKMLSSFKPTHLTIQSDNQLDPAACEYMASLQHLRSLAICAPLVIPTKDRSIFISHLHQLLQKDLEQLLLNVESLPKDHLNTLITLFRGNSLTLLNIQNLYETTMQTLSALNLKELTLIGRSHNKLSVIKSLGYQSSLEILNISHMYASTLKQLSITHLHLENFLLDPETWEAFSHMHCLSKLVLCNVEVSSKAISGLKNCRSLREVEFLRTCITDEWVKELQTSKPNLRIKIESPKL